MIENDFDIRVDCLKEQLDQMSTSLRSQLNEIKLKLKEYIKFYN